MKRRHIAEGRREGDSLVVRLLTSRLNEFDMSQQLDRELHGVMEAEDFKKLVLDCEGFEYAISEAFDVLIKISKELRERDRFMVACRMTPFLRDVCTTLRLDTIIPIHDTLEEALQA